MQETLLVGGKPIRLDVHEPSSQEPAARPAIVLMHGAGGNVNWWSDRIAPHVTDAGLSLFTPHYFDRTDTVRADYATITDGVHVPLWMDTLQAVLAAIASRPTVDPNRIAVVGVSLGSFLSLGLAARCSSSVEEVERGRIRCLVDLSGGLTEPYAAQATSHFPPTLILHGERDSVVPVHYARDLDALLTRLQVPHETHILPDEDHWFSSAAQPLLLLKMANFLGKYMQ